MDKRFIPGSHPDMGLELPDGDTNSLVSKSGDNWDNGYNFDEKIDDKETTFKNLAEEVDVFDPNRANMEKRKRVAELGGNKVISLGEVSMMIEDRDNNSKLESDYFKAYEYYLSNGDYDRECPKDNRFTQSIRLICRNAAHLDLDQGTREYLSNIGTINFEGGLDPNSVHLYKEIYNEILKDIKDNDRRHRNDLDKTMREMGKIGKVGESLLYLYEDLKNKKANNKILKPFVIDEKL